jgi:ABC-2 type transport system ATP-binding protein
VLEVRQLAKSYGKLRALDDVSFNVARGEFVALLGPNGAGKTTLFQLLTGLFVPDRGEIAIVGHKLTQDPTACLAALGIVFQQATLDLDLSVAANLRFAASLHGLARAVTSDRIADELAAFGLADARERACRELSGGNRRKVELARALLHKPELLLLDEPTVGLDPRSRRELLERAQRLCAAGVGVLWATHLVEEAEIADRILVLHRGKLLRDTEPASMRGEGGAESLAEAFLKLTATPSSDG